MRVTFGAVMLVMTLGCGNASTAARQSDSLILQLDSPGTAASGAPIPLKLTLRNSGKQPVQVMLGGRPPFDFLVTTPDGAEVWRWSADQIIQAILEVRTLKPGEQLSYSAEWHQTRNGGAPASRGRYLVRGILKMDPPDTLETAPRELLLE